MDELFDDNLTFYAGIDVVKNNDLNYMESDDEVVIENAKEEVNELPVDVDLKSKYKEPDV